MKNMVYIQSGGPTSVINTSLYGAIKEAKKPLADIIHLNFERKSTTLF